MGSELTTQKWPLHFVWVTNYYDHPISGTCIHEWELCRFEWDPVYHEEDVVYNIYSLTPKEKAIWRIRQWLFEVCIGTHCTYEGPQRREHYRRKEPRWFWDIVFKTYFKIKRL